MAMSPLAATSIEPRIVTYQGWGEVKGRDFSGGPPALKDASSPLAPRSGPIGGWACGRAWQCAPRIMAKDWSAEKYEEPSVSVTVCLPALIRSQSSSPLL